ncbi:hypothetical protein Y032_1005g3369 [Ancylostoma ceylanicum]|uniref:Post-SET domain-containing protein n=2 Tax=Ancylostoma ceylanicum TaxID=53326 RepID=A0A016W9I2_9BILA|nr:hypothetical protein Y032_1005g3369 [Ancylostoma ceylanicum]
MDIKGYVNTYNMLAVLLSINIFELCRAYDPGSLPRQIECFSCMSLSYQTSWKYLQTTYIYPKVFTDRCRDPGSERGMPTVPCSTVCVSLLEPDIEAGVFIGYKHIRGCMDRVLRHGFNQTALRTHRFHHHNQCRTLSRAHLFNPARATDPPAIGDVQLCSCYGDRCNGRDGGLLSLVQPRNKSDRQVLAQWIACRR